jgi:hypothetical protein
MRAPLTQDANLLLPRACCRPHASLAPEPCAPPAAGTRPHAEKLAQVHRLLKEGVTSLNADDKCAPLALHPKLLSPLCGSSKILAHSALPVSDSLKSSRALPAALQATSEPNSVWVQVLWCVKESPPQNNVRLHIHKCWPKANQPLPMAVLLHPCHV